MLCYKSGVDIIDACGKSLMHPSGTRSIRVPSTTTDAQEAMRDVLTQYGEFIEARRGELRTINADVDKPDMRIGWLLWQQSLRQFLYFEEEMVAPNPDDYIAEWVPRKGAGTRKSSTNLWIYETEGGKKRFSVTTEAGAKIQPYFDVPPPNDPSLYVFTVIGESIETGLVRVWITEATSREIERLLGGVDAHTVSAAILEAARELEELGPIAEHTLEDASEHRITEEAYLTLKRVFPGVSDEHSFQLLARYLRQRASL